MHILTTVIIDDVKSLTLIAGFETKERQMKHDEEQKQEQKKGISHQGNTISSGLVYQEDSAPLKHQPVRKIDSSIYVRRP